MKKTRLLSFVLLSLAVTAVPLAFAQPKAPTPPAATAPAATTEPAARPEMYEGGARPSPLNPEKNEMPQGADAAAETVDYDRLLGDIAALRARIAAVGDTLYHAKLAVLVETEGEKARIGRLVLSIDDGVVFASPAGFRADDPRVLYERSVAPGRHAVTIDVERKDAKNDAFQSAQRSRFIVEVPKDNRLTAEIRISDDSTMGADFPGDRSGRYDLRVRLKAAARPIGK